MKAWLPIYEGDSIVHYGASVALPKGSTPEAAPAQPSPWRSLSRAVVRFFDWLERATERARYRQLENYLADSGDVFELERRIRRLERSHGAGFDPYS